MKTDPARPIYEPRHITVRRELFRFADQHKVLLTGGHHPIKPVPDFHGLSSTDEHWIWFLRDRWYEDEHYQIPVGELLSLLNRMYPGKPLHLHVPEGELGIDALYVLVPAVTQRREVW